MKEIDNKILKEILQELKYIHSHIETLETFYKFVNRVEMKKEEEKVPENKK